MGIKGQPAVGKAFQTGVGAQEIGRCGHDEGIGRENRLAHGLVVVFNGALSFEQTQVASAAGCNVELRQPQECQIVGHG